MTWIDLPEKTGWHWTFVPALSGAGTLEPWCVHADAWRDGGAAGLTASRAQLGDVDVTNKAVWPGPWFGPIEPPAMKKGPSPKAEGMPA